MIGSLLYLIVSQPDIRFSVYLCACSRENPKELDIKVVEMIFRYSIGTTNLGLLYP